jgi:hypothetical protein
MRMGTELGVAVHPWIGAASHHSASASNHSSPRSHLGLEVWIGIHHKLEPAIHQSARLLDHGSSRPLLEKNFLESSLAHSRVCAEIISGHIHDLILLTSHRE